MSLTQRALHASAVVLLSSAWPAAAAMPSPAQSEPSAPAPSVALAAPAAQEQTLELSLDLAFQIALKNNLGLKLQAVNSEVSLYNYRATWGSFDWVLDARLGYTDAQYQPRDVFGGSSQTDHEYGIDFTRPFATTGGTLKTHIGTVESRTNSAFQVVPRSSTDIISVQYTQPILRGAWREYATATQREGELASLNEDEHLRQVRQKLLLDVSLAYWNLVAARDTLGVADSSLELARTQVDQDQRRLEAGIGTDLNVIQAQAEAATREEVRLRADVDVRKAADDLKQLLIPGTDAGQWGTNVVPTTPLPEPGGDDTVVGWETAFQIAIDRRSELRQQRLQVDIAEVRHEKSKGDKKPGLDLDLQASSQGFSPSEGSAFETTARFDFPTYKAALVFNYALGNTTAGNSELAAWASVRAARLTYDDLESKIVAEVRDGVRQVRYQALAVRAADKSLDLAQRQLAAEQARFQNDISTNFQVLQFQQDLATAMSRARSARAGYAKATVTLTSVQGLLGEAQNP